VVAVLGFTGFEQAPVLGEEAKSPRRTIPVTTYLALGMIGIVYAASAWAMAAHAGTSRVVAAAAAQGPGLLFGLGGGILPQAAQWLFLTSLFAAMLSFHNCCWRYAFALGREGVLPGVLSRTGSNNIPKTASLAQSATGLAAITACALTGAQPMQDLFFDLGTTGGFGVLLLYALTSAAVIAYFTRHPGQESTWSTLIAPALAAVLLTGIAVLAVTHYGTLLGVPPGSAAAWALPACYAAVAALGLGWGLTLRIRRPDVYATIGLGAHAASVRAGTAFGTRP
jgi:amino acid transporter